MAAAEPINPSLIPGLPDDVSQQTLCRLPLCCHPSLSLVCRAWRSLLRSPSFFHLRSLLGLSRPSLCLGLRVPSSPSPSPLSFFLSAPRCPALPLPPPPLPAAGSAATSLGPLLFLLGGAAADLPSRSLQIFDSRPRRWRLGPPMAAPRRFAAAAVVRRRLYALGGCLPSDDPWIESLDLDDAAAAWTPVPGPPSPDLRHRWMHGCVVLGGKVLAVADRGGVAFDPASGEWGGVPAALDLGWKGRAVEAAGMVCSYDYLGRIKGYDPVGDRWMELEGVGRSLPRFLAGASMANVGGKLCLVWEGRGRGEREVELLFAEIELAREEEEGRLRGAVVWSSSEVLPLPRGSTITHCLALCL